MRPKIWAHRGASGWAPENTIEAFRLAMEMGADAVELDVHLSQDGQVVVAHDETVDRVADGKGRIVQMTLAQLKQLNFNRMYPQVPHAQIPTLKEVFLLLEPTQMEINVEIKNNIEPYPGIEHQCIDLAREMGMLDRVWFSSFNHHTLLRVKKIEPQVRCGILYECTMVRPWEYAKVLGIEAIHPHFSELMVEGEVMRCHQQGLAVHAWTVNSPEHLRFAARQKPDALITNYPDVARKVLAEEVTVATDD